MKQPRGAPFIGFQLEDSYNKLGEYDKKSFDGSTKNSLIEILKKQFKNEIDLL